MYYNIDSYNYDMERLFSDYTAYRLGQGWPAYKNVSVGQMAEVLSDNAFLPKYDTEAGKSKIVEPAEKENISKRDIELMKALYTELNGVINKFVERIIDDYEYMESPIYNEDGIDRETLAQIVDRVISLAEEEMDEPQEINLEMQQSDIWGKKNLLRSIVESIVLSEIFAVRRPNHRRIKENYVFVNGVYDGIRER